MLSAYFDKASEFLISLITGVIVCITDMITLKHTLKEYDDSIIGGEI